MAESQYTASKAANVVLFIAIASAVVFGVAGVLYLRGGDDLGWLLLLLAVLPLVLAAVVRSRVRDTGD